MKPSGLSWEVLGVTPRAWEKRWSLRLAPSGAVLAGRSILSLPDPSIILSTPLRTSSVGSDKISHLGSPSWPWQPAARGPLGSFTQDGAPANDLWMFVCPGLGPQTPLLLRLYPLPRAFCGFGSQSCVSSFLLLHLNLTCVAPSPVPSFARRGKGSFP